MYSYLKLSSISADLIYYINTSRHGFKGLRCYLKSKQKTYKLFFLYLHKTFRLPALFAEVQQFHLNATEISLQNPLFFVKFSASGEDQKAEQTTHIYTKLKHVEWNKRWGVTAACLQSFFCRQLWEFISVIWIWNRFVLQGNGQRKSWVSQCDVFAAALFLSPTETRTQ